MTPQEIGEAAIALKQGTLAEYRKGDEIAILASALCKCLADLPTAEERLGAVLLVLAAFSTIGIYIDNNGHPSFIMAPAH